MKKFEIIQRRIKQFKIKNRFLSLEKRKEKKEKKEKNPNKKMQYQIRKKQNEGVIIKNN